MGIFLRHSHNVKPLRWGSFRDVQYAIRKNCEEIYKCDSADDVFIMPLFWGAPYYDYSKNANHGDGHGGLLYKNKGLYFDGTGYIESSDDDGTTAKLTVTAWIKSYGHVDNDTGAVIVSVYDTDSSNRKWALILRDLVVGVSQGELTAFFGDPVDGSFEGESASGQVPVERLNTHVGMTFNAGTVKFYVQGLEYSGSVRTGSIPLSLYDTSEPIKIGSLFAGGSADYLYKGYIPELRIANVVRTAEQIALFNARPWDLYRQVSRPVYSLPAAVGWAGKVNGATNPAKINGVAVANISKVMGIS